MNYLGLLSIFLILAATWMSPSFAPQVELHTELQHRVSDLIVDAAIKHRKSVDEVKIGKIWTKRKNKSKIEIRFQYSLLNEKSIIEEVAGHAQADLQEDQSWLVHSVTLDQQALTF